MPTAVRSSSTRGRWVRWKSQIQRMNAAGSRPPPGQALPDGPGPPAPPPTHRTGGGTGSRRGSRPRPIKPCPRPQLGHRLPDLPVIFLHTGRQGHLQIIHVVLLLPAPGGRQGTSWNRSPHTMPSTVPAVTSRIWARNSGSI